MSDPTEAAPRQLSLWDTEALESLSEPGRVWRRRYEKEVGRAVAGQTAPGRASGVDARELQALHTPADLEGLSFGDQIGFPGEYPMTRGIYPSMYRGRLWTMRQYAGFATAEETNTRFRYLLECGQTGLSTAFDLPTQIGYDSDHKMALGEVGRVGVAIDSVRDMEVLFDDIDIGAVTTSMTINATAATLLALYCALADRRGVALDRLGGTVQNDILKEYIARGTYIYPPGPSLRLVTDVFRFCAQRVPRWNTISISGYHIREAGSTAVQEIAFTLGNAIAYTEAGLSAGLAVNDFAPRLSFFFNAHSHLFEEVAKFRAARRLWARIMKERFGATNPKAWRMRFHAQTAGSTLTAQQPLNNIVRVAVQALAAVLGGAQSLHTNGMDEALALPTEQSARTALRTQQLLAYEHGAGDAIDPLGGSFTIEAMTAGWTPIDRVGDVDLLLRKSDRCQHAVEQLAGASDKGLALQILVASRRLADQHDPGSLAAARKAQRLGRALERAAVEGADQGFELGKGGGLAGSAFSGHLRLPVSGGKGKSSHPVRQPGRAMAGAIPGSSARRSFTSSLAD